MMAAPSARSLTSRGSPSGRSTIAIHFAGGRTRFLIFAYCLGESVGEVEGAVAGEREAPRPTATVSGPGHGRNTNPPVLVPVDDDIPDRRELVAGGDRVSSLHRRGDLILPPLVWSSSSPL